MCVREREMTPHRYFGHNRVLLMQLARDRDEDSDAGRLNP